MKKSKNILILFLLFSFFYFIPETRAETIPIKDGTFGVSYGGSYIIPTNTFSIQGGTTNSKEFYLYNYEGYSRPYTYVVIEFCSGNVDLIRNAYISNANYSGNWINDGAGVTYVTNDTCTNASYTGYVIKKQFQIGRYQDMDGTGEELVASAYLNIKSNLSYYSWFRLNNVYLSSDDELSVLAQNQKDTQELISKIEQSSTSIVQSQEQVKQKLDSLNSSIGQTNDKLDDVNDNLGDLNDNITNNDISGSQNTANGFFDSFTDNDYGLSSIITIPLSSIQKITNSTCVPINLPIPFTNKNIPLPCMNTLYQQNVPVLLNIWQIVSFGLISYAVIVDIFAMVKKFKDPNDDKLEVMAL